MPQLIEPIESVETPFNTLVARRRGRWIDLDVEGATFASWHPVYRLTGYSWDGLTAAAVLGPTTPERVLLLGLGGGTCLHQLRALLPKAALVAVEIDPGVVELARRHMELDSLDVEVHVEDAKRFLGRRAQQGRFDVVLDDLYLTGPDDVVRAEVPEGDRLEALIACLRHDDGGNPAGIVAANVIDDAGHEDVRRRSRKAFVDRFDEVRIVRPPRGLNEILVGARKLGSRHDLVRFAPSFDEEHDRALWQRISVRKR